MESKTHKMKQLGSPRKPTQTSLVEDLANFHKIAEKSIRKSQARTERNDYIPGSAINYLRMVDDPMLDRFFNKMAYTQGGDQYVQTWHK